MVTDVDGDPPVKSPLTNSLMTKWSMSCLSLGTWADHEVAADVVCAGVSVCVNVCVWYTSKKEQHYKPNHLKALKIHTHRSKP